MIQHCPRLLRCRDYAEIEADSNNSSSAKRVSYSGRSFMILYMCVCLYTYMYAYLCHSWSWCRDKKATDAVLCESGPRGTSLCVPRWEKIQMCSLFWYQHRATIQLATTTTISCSSEEIYAYLNPANNDTFGTGLSWAPCNTLVWVSSVSKKRSKQQVPVVTCWSWLHMAIGRHGHFILTPPVIWSQDLFGSSVPMAIASAILKITMCTALWTK